MKRQDYNEVFANSKDKTLSQLWEIFSECMNAAGVKAEVRLLVAKQKLEYAGISDCGVVGKGKNAAMLLSGPFVNLFREEKLTQEDVKSIFLHELSHVLHNDHFMPLWALWFSQSKVFTYTIVSFVAGILFVFLSGYLGGKVIIKGNLLNIARVFAVVPIAFVIFKRVIWNVISIIMREREFLADVRSAHLYATDKMVNALKKWGIFLPARGGLPAFSFAGILRKVDRHPSILDRIEALGQKKEPEPEKKKIPSALQMASYCMYFLIILVALFIPLIALPGTDVARLIIIVGWASSFLFVTALVIENVFPLRFLDRQVFEQGLSSSFTSKLWIKIHLNNFLIALIICSLIALSGFVFHEDVTYIRWHRTFFFRAVLFYFLYCTALSVMLVAVYWREKKKKSAGGEEVPVEVVWDKRRKPKS